MTDVEKSTPDKKIPERDDFTQIRGINQKIANRLYDAGILTFTKLAAMSAVDIVSRIGPAAGVSIETINKRDWPGQAASLSEARKKPSVSGSLSSGIVSPPGLQAVSYVIELFVDENKHVNKTRIYHVQSNDEEDWKNWEETRLINFFHQRPELALPGKASVLLSKTEPVDSSQEKSISASNSKKELPETNDQVQNDSASDSSTVESLPLNPSLRKPEIIPANEKFPTQLISGNQPFSLRLAMDFPGSYDTKPGKMNFSVLVKAQNLSNNRSQILGQCNGKIDPNRPIILNVREKLLSPGIYKVLAQVTLGEIFPDRINHDSLKTLLSGNLLEVY